MRVRRAAKAGASIAAATPAESRHTTQRPLSAGQPLYVGRLVLLAGALLVPYAMYLTEADYRPPAAWHAALFALLGGAITAACDGLSASSRGHRTRAWLLYSVAVGLHGAWYAVLRLSDTR